jgi:hypothetical protein
MKSFFLGMFFFSISIPVLALCLSYFQNPALTAQAEGCSGQEVFRTSDGQCYILQGE